MGAGLLPVGFNPRAREGRDGQRTVHGSRCTGVSTHAPARGATAAPLLGPRRRRRFNPRAREGRDSAAVCATWPTRAFQPTRPRGARPAARARRVTTEKVSTHAPARGATWRAKTGKLGTSVSTHAPARGATARHSRIARSRKFQPTRPRGARPTHNSTRRAPPARFNPRAREGRDRPLLQLGALGPEVSTHAPARGATVDKITLAHRRTSIPPSANLSEIKQPTGLQGSYPPRNSLKIYTFRRSRIPRGVAPSLQIRAAA